MMKKFYIAEQSKLYERGNEQCWYFDNKKEAIAFCEGLMAHIAESEYYYDCMHWCVKEHFIYSTNDEAREDSCSTGCGIIRPNSLADTFGNCPKVVWFMKHHSTSAPCGKKFLQHFSQHEGEGG